MSTNQSWTDDAARMTGGPDDEKKKKRKGIFIAISAAVALLLLGLGGVGVYNAIRDGAAAESSVRDNIMALIQRYMDNGEYGRALDLLEDLLIKNANDMDCWRRS